MSKYSVILVVICNLVLSCNNGNVPEAVIVEKYSVNYSLGNDDFIEKYRDKIDRINPLDNNEYEEGEYVYLQSFSQIIIDGIGYSHSWNTKSDGTGINYNRNSNGFFMPNSDITLYAIWEERLFLLDKEFDPREYGFYPQVPEELIGTWSDNVWVYLHPDDPTPVYQLSVIVFDETTATKWEQRLDGSKLTNPQTHYIRVEYNDYDKYYNLFCVNKNSSHPLDGELTQGYYGTCGTKIDSETIFIGANKYDTRVYNKVH